MVRSVIRSFYRCFWILFLACLCSLASCNNDLFGLFGSSALDERLKERNSFRFLTSEDLSPNSWGDNYSFVVIADTHIEQGNAHGLERIKNVIESHPDIKFAVLLGDITQSGHRQDVGKFLEIADEIRAGSGVPCYPVIGNHDIYFGNWSVWKNLIGSTRYRIDSDETTLFILDSANAYFGRSQLDWLERELRTANKRVFVFSHVNLFVQNPANIQQLSDVRERARITSILQGRADFMFMGHSHRQLLRQAGGVSYLNLEDYRSNRTYCLVKVTDSGISYTIEKL